MSVDTTISLIRTGSRNDKDKLHLQPLSTVLNYLLRCRDGLQDADVKVIEIPKKSSAEWQAEYPEVKVIDADGWDRKNFAQSWREPITYSEYQRRVMFSTISVQTSDGSTAEETPHT